MWVTKVNHHSNHNFDRWYGYHSQLWVVYDIVLATLVGLNFQIFQVLGGSSSKPQEYSHVQFRLERLWKVAMAQDSVSRHATCPYGWLDLRSGDFFQFAMA